jgi:hypothetical protein
MEVVDLDVPLNLAAEGSKAKVAGRVPATVRSMDASGGSYVAVHLS